MTEWKDTSTPELEARYRVNTTKYYEVMQAVAEAARNQIVGFAVGSPLIMGIGD